MNTNQVARIASLLGEPARTAMLLELMDGRWLTANELARAARVQPPTASRHLALLVEGGLLQVQPRGRHRYHRLASAEVAQALEQLMQLALRAAVPQRRTVTGPKDAALRTARTCYDHLAGRLGVAIAERLQADGAVVFDAEAGRLTGAGRDVLARLGIDLAPAAPARGLSCRPCLDWSERRHHLAGRVGRLLCSHCLDQGWLRRRDGTRALDVTPAGRRALRDWLGTDVWENTVS